MLTCTPAEAADALVSGRWTLVDVREAQEFALVSIDGALHIPLGELPARLGEIPTDRPAAVLCHHGSRSAMAQQFLNAGGSISVYNVVGGIDAWATTVDPSLPRY